MLKQITKILQKPLLPVQYNAVRFRYAIRGIPPTSAKSLKDVLAEMNSVDPEIAFKVDIGLPPPKAKTTSKERREYITNKKKDTTLEKLSRDLRLDVSLDDVKAEFLNTQAPSHIRMAADHYGVFQDLFGDAYFTPYVNLDIVFPHDDGKLAPVHRGNVVKPREALNQPEVTFPSESNELWTLVLTNPDGHFTEENKEYVHWFVGNIPGGDVSKGQTVYDYLPPFPPLGIGFQRFIFVLYKQNTEVDFSKLQQDFPCRDLKKRTFETLEFYRSHQDVLTPAGLAFFQSDWDKAVRNIFHEILDMEEPRFEYDHTPQFVQKQRWFPKRRAFNLYLDKYKDPKDLAREFLVKKLADTNPFVPPKKPAKYPNIYKVDRNKVATWIITEQRRVKLGLGRINQQADDIV